jgi:hypothetical protein
MVGEMPRLEDPYVGWSLSDRLQLLAFEAELAHLPRGLIVALWEAIDGVRGCSGGLARTGPRPHCGEAVLISSITAPTLERPFQSQHESEQFCDGKSREAVAFTVGCRSDLAPRTRGTTRGRSSPPDPSS